MASFIGEYICKVDDKGRLSLPSALRKQLPSEAHDRLVLNRGFEQHLNLYPANEWEKLAQRIGQLNLFVKRNREFVRKFNNGATELEIDSSSRILIPKSLMEYASITKEVILFAYANRIEIWSKELYEREINSEAESFADLAEQVMGTNGQSTTGNASQQLP